MPHLLFLVLLLSSCATAEYAPITPDHQHFARAYPQYREVLARSQRVEKSIERSEILPQGSYGEYEPIPEARSMPAHPLAKDSTGELMEADVLVEFDVLGHGRTANIRTTQDRPGPDFTRDVRRAVRLWIYSPAVSDGVGFIRADQELVVSFQTQDETGECPHRPGTFEGERELLVICAQKA